MIKHTIGELWHLDDPFWVIWVSCDMSILSKLTTSGRQNPNPKTTSTRRHSILAHANGKDSHTNRQSMWTRRVISLPRHLISVSVSQWVCYHIETFDTRPTVIHNLNGDCSWTNTSCSQTRFFDKTDVREIMVFVQNRHTKHHSTRSNHQLGIVVKADIFVSRPLFTHNLSWAAFFIWHNHPSNFDRWLPSSVE